MSVIGILGGAHQNYSRDKFTVLAGTVNYSTTDLHNDQSSVRLHGSSIAAASRVWRPWDVPASEFMYHISYKSTTNGIYNDVAGIGWGKDEVELGRVSFEDNTARATILVNGVVKDTSPLAAYTLNTWETLHVHVKLGGAGVGFVKVYKDGLFASPIAEEIVDDTDPTAAITANGFYVRMTSSDRLSNIVAIDPTDGTAPTTLDEIGTLGVYTTSPDADSATNTDWTPDAGGVGYTQIDEIPNSDSDYIEAAAVGDRSTFSHEPAVGVGVEVLAVRYSARIQRVGTAAGANISITRRRSGADYDEAPQGAPTDGDIEKIFNTEPVAAAALTPANVDDTEYGAVTVT